MARPTKAKDNVVLKDFNIAPARLYIIGTAPLIVHAFPEKARKLMLDKQMKLPQEGRDARDPYAEVEASLYKLPDGTHGIPAIAFKAAAVTACTTLSDMTKVLARQAFRVPGISMQSPGTIADSYVRTSLIPLVAPEPIIREDMARLSGPGSSFEVRFRPEYSPWGCVVDVQYNEGAISLSQLLSMFRAAGMGVGVGDYRPEKDGECGTFAVTVEDVFNKWQEEELKPAIALAESEALAA